MNLREQQREFPAEEPRIKHAMPSLDCALQKRKTSKDKVCMCIYLSSLLTLQCYLSLYENEDTSHSRFLHVEKISLCC